MKLFKIVFEENLPASTTELATYDTVGLKIEHPSGRRKIKWIIISANDESESLKKAEQVAIDLVLTEYIL